jgi:hypothetical protein
MIEEVRAQLDTTRFKLRVLDLILGATTKPPAKHTHRRQRLLFEIDLSICVAEYDQVIVELNEQRASLEDLQQVLGSYRMSKAPTAQPNDLRQVAEAAQATCEGVTADMALLLEGQDRDLLSPLTIEPVRSGITRKCQTAITNLQVIVDAMGGAE